MVPVVSLIIPVSKERRADTYVMDQTFQYAQFLAARGFAISIPTLSNEPSMEGVKFALVMPGFGGSALARDAIHMAEEASVPVMFWPDVPDKPA